MFGGILLLNLNLMSATQSENRHLEVREGGRVGPADPPREGADRRRDTVRPVSCMAEIYIHVEFQVLVKVSTNSETRKGDHTSVYKQIIFSVSFSFKL